MLGANFGSISECVIDGNIAATIEKVGGLVGESLGSVTLSRPKGSVTGLFRVGGLIGDLLAGGIINNSYSNSSVSAFAGGDGIGGLVGLVASGTTIEDTYSSGSVQTIGDFHGGFIGLNQGGTITASFWDVDTSGQNASDGGTGKTTAEMQMQSTFDPPWDFTNIWMIDEGNDYPRLLIEQAGPLCVVDCQCDDGNDCNGVETCNAGSCVDGIPLECGAFDDECAIGTCNPETGNCEQDPATPAGSVCREAESDCDAEEVCDGKSPICPNDVCAAAGSPCDLGGLPGTCDGECGCVVPEQIPTVNEWGMVVLLLLVMIAGSVMLRGRPRAREGAARLPP